MCPAVARHQTLVTPGEYFRILDQRNNTAALHAAGHTRHIASGVRLACACACGRECVTQFEVLALSFALCCRPLCIHLAFPKASIIVS